MTPDRLVIYSPTNSHFEIKNLQFTLLFFGLRKWKLLIQNPHTTETRLSFFCLRNMAQIDGCPQSCNTCIVEETQMQHYFRPYKPYSFSLQENQGQLYKPWNLVCNNLDHAFRQYGFDPWDHTYRQYKFGLRDHTYRQYRFGLWENQYRYIGHEILSVVTEIILHFLPTNEITQSCHIFYTWIYKEKLFSKKINNTNCSYFMHI